MGFASLQKVYHIPNLHNLLRILIHIIVPNHLFICTDYSKPIHYTKTFNSLLVLVAAVYAHFFASIGLCVFNNISSKSTYTS